MREIITCYCTKCCTGFDLWNWESVSWSEWEAIDAASDWASWDEELKANAFAQAGVALLRINVPSEAAKYAASPRGPAPVSGMPGAEPGDEGSPDAVWIPPQQQSPITGAPTPFEAQTQAANQALARMEGLEIARSRMPSKGDWLAKHNKKFNDFKKTCADTCKGMVEETTNQPPPGMAEVAKDFYVEDMRRMFE
jgi:hypothetical protein